jgi:hypothetical protein
MKRLMVIFVIVSAGIHVMPVYCVVPDLTPLQVVAGGEEQTIDSGVRVSRSINNTLPSCP